MASTNNGNTDQKNDSIPNAICDKFPLPIKRIVLFLPGSFNPVTIAHLRLFELARDYYHLRSIQVVEGIISPVNNFYEKPGLATAKDRINMLKAAVANSNWLRIDSWEADQTTWTRTKIALDHHAIEVKERHGEGTEIRLLSGADVVRSMLNDKVWAPQDIEDIMSNYGVACITRLSTQSNGSNTPLSVTEGMPDHWKKRIDIIEDWVVNDISATNIRNRLENGCSIKYIVPDETIEYILKNGLYNSNKCLHLADWIETKRQ